MQCEVPKTCLNNYSGTANFDCQNGAAELLKLLYLCLLTEPSLQARALSPRTSWKVVSIAVVFCASFRRVAMRWRMRVIFSRRSPRLPNLRAGTTLGRNQVNKFPDCCTLQRASTVFDSVRYPKYSG